MKTKFHKFRDESKDFEENLNIIIDVSFSDGKKGLLISYKIN